MMNRSTLTAVQIAAILAVTALMCVIIYYAGSGISGPSLANASGNMPYPTWRANYFKIVYTTGIISGLMLLLWHIISRFSLKISRAKYVGKRSLWSMFGALSLLTCIAAPKLLANLYKIQINAVITTLFIVCLFIIGYWVCSIFTTPRAYKYTPVGASLILAPKDRK